MHAELVWLAVAVLLALGEAASGEMFMLMLAGGALGGAGAALLGGPLWVQAVAFAVVSLVLVLGVRPVVRRRLLASLPEHETNTAALTGREAVVQEAVTASAGLIAIDGDTWTARPLFDGETFDAGDLVHVHEISGATAVVVRAY